MHTCKEEIQLNGRNGDIVNAEASIHPEKDAQIPERVLDPTFRSFSRMDYRFFHRAVPRELR